jgi:site-specific recombinase XerD
MTLEAEWIASILSDSTKRRYSRDLKLFREFLGKTDQEIIDLRKVEGKRFTTRLIIFYEHLKKKGLSQNSARTAIVSLQSFFSYYDLPVKVSKKLPDLSMRLESYRPSVEDLQKLYSLNDIHVKSWLSLSRDCPARLGDLLQIMEKVQSSEENEFLIQSSKENVVGKVYISPETRELFRKKPNIPKSERGIAKFLERACNVAGLPKINQHLLRKVWISQAINLGIQETIVKILTFKSVPKDILTYFLDRSDLRDSWLKVVDSLPLEAKGGNGRVSNIEEALERVGIAVAKVITNMAREELRKEGVISMMTKDELDPLKDWKEILLNYITFDEVIPPQPKKIRKD